jgi:glycosyltransferase involved in cell wall biosynthesis
MTRDLVVFGEDWGRHPSSTQHLVRRLAESRRVIWINSIGLRRPRLGLRDLGRVAGKIRNMIARPVVAALPTAAQEPIPDDLSVHTLAAVPAPASRLAFAANRRLLGRQIRRQLDARGMRNPVLWTSLPTALPAVGEIGERAVVYYCGDDFGALAGVDHAPVLEMERRLVERADLVLAASDVLARRFPKGKTRVIPHGADIGRFSQPAERAVELPSGRRCAGFYGSISDWIDVPLLAATAARLPDWTFVLVGPVRTDVGALAMRPNVRFVPAQPHAALPGFVQHWDVSLVPFKSCAQIEACNPLKLREYLAAGTPVASTEFPALRPYRDLVHVGRDAGSFVAAIEAAAGDGARNAQRMARVAGEGWERRAADVAAALDSL